MFLAILEKFAAFATEENWIPVLIRAQCSEKIL